MKTIVLLLTLFATVYAEVQCGATDVVCPTNAALTESKYCESDATVTDSEYEVCSTTYCCSWNCPNVYGTGDEVATWEGMGNAAKECPTGLAVKPDNTCGTLSCDDEDICCKKTCLSADHTCSEGLIRPSMREDTECDFGPNLDECHDSICCLGPCGEASNGLNGKSLDGSCGSDSWMRKDWDPATCAQDACTTSECCVITCDGTGHCSDAGLPNAPWDHNASVADNYCDSSGCTDEKCCGATCRNSGLTCPAGTKFASHDVTDHIKCTQGDDAYSCGVGDCCWNTCSSYTCPEGKTLREHDHYCPLGVCSDDLCCADSCSDWLSTNTCDETHIGNDDEICDPLSDPYTPDVQDGGCNAEKCCSAVCTSHTCPTGSSHIANAGNEKCEESEGGCTDDRCCQPPKCADSTTVTCDAGFGLNSGECSFDGCSKETCCSPLCSSVQSVVTCSEFQQFVGDATCSGLCNEMSCCAGMCYGFDCPAGKISRSLNDYHSCDDTGCTEEDCCGETCEAWGAVEGNGCPAGLRLKPDDACFGGSCNQDMCCQAVCADWYGAGNSCEEGYVARDAMDMHQCGSAGCNSFQCCRGPCSTYMGCGMDQRSIRGPTQCAADTCTADECCGDKVKCATFDGTCDGGKKSDDWPCLGETCQESDCCEVLPDGAGDGAGTVSGDDYDDDEDKFKVSLTVTFRTKPSNTNLRAASQAFCETVKMATGVAGSIYCWIDHPDDWDHSGERRRLSSESWEFAFEAEFVLDGSMEQSTLDKIVVDFAITEELTTANGGVPIDPAFITTSVEDPNVKYYYRLVWSVKYFTDKACQTVNEPKAVEDEKKWNASPEIKVCKSSVTDGAATLDGVLETTSPDICSDTDLLGHKANVCNDGKMYMATPFCALVSAQTCDSKCKDQTACDKAAKEAGITVDGVAGGGPSKDFSGANHVAPAFALALCTVALF